MSIRWRIFLEGRSMPIAELPLVETLYGMDATAFGLRLRELRKAAGVTQKALAAAVAKPQPTIARWETGELTADAIILPKIASALGCTFDDLLAEPPAPPKPKRS